jgi:predicted transcriptional regulator
MLNTCSKDNKQKYVAMGKLTYKTKLKQMLKEELGYQGKPKVLDLLASEIENITNECFVPIENVSLGQIKILVPHLNDRPSWAQTMEDTVLVPVVLTLIADEDKEAYKNGDKSSVVMQRKLARIAKEAISQKGVLTTSIAAELLGIKQQTVSKYIEEYYRREDKIIPMRGFIHDMGRTTTHKRWIIELYLKGYTENEIQKLTDHKISSIDRYIKKYIAIASIIEEVKTIDTLKISKLLNTTHSSVKEYTAIYLEYKGTGNITRLDYYSKINDETDLQLNCHS